MSENVISILTRLATKRKPGTVGYGETDGSGLSKGGLHGDKASDQAGHEAAAHGEERELVYTEPSRTPLAAVGGCAAPTWRGPRPARRKLEAYRARGGLRSRLKPFSPTDTLDGRAVEDAREMVIPKRTS